MMRSRHHLLRILGACVALGSARGQVLSPYQPALSGSSLANLGPVALAGSDAASARFQSQFLPSLLNLVQTNLSETRSLTDAARFALQPDRLVLGESRDVRLYFVGEGAGYRNTLGLNQVSPQGSSAGLIFPNASTSVSYYGGTPTGSRSASNPLMPGDFVDLGTIAGGTRLDFFLIADGFSGGRNVFGTQASQNPDRIEHVVAFALEDSPLLLIGFEDLMGGGDRDYNDLLFAVDVGARNVAVLSGSEPSSVVLLMMFSLGAFGRPRRQEAR